MYYKFLTFLFSLCIALVCCPAFAESPIKVALVFDRGGKDDQSFNTAAFKGATQAKDELKAYIKYVEASDDNAYEPMLRSFAQKGFDLVIAVGIAQVEPLRKVAEKFPKVHFAIVDAEVALPNVRSLLFEEHEGSYLVGAIAALTSKTGAIGFIGGMDVPLIRRFELGYGAGARKVKPGIKLMSNFVGITGEAWNNPVKAKELAIAQYGAGADVIFVAAGASGFGLFDAAEEQKKLAIGVDSNQNWIKPGYILTSMLKRVDVAVFNACQDTAQGKFSGGVKRFGLFNNGIDYAIDKYNEKLLPAAVRKTVDKLKSEIIAKKIEVPDFYKK